MSGLFMTRMELTKTPQLIMVPMSEQIPSLYSDGELSCVDEREKKKETSVSGDGYAEDLSC